MGRRTARRIQRSRRTDRVQKQSAATPPASHPLMELQRSIGSQAVQRLIGSPYIQTKLQVSSPQDEAEKKADRAAEGVMRSAEPNLAGSSSSGNSPPASAHERTGSRSESPE